MAWVGAMLAALHLWMTVTLDFFYQELRLIFDGILTMDQVVGPAFRFLGALVGFLGGVVAIYLKWKYAESQLHKRLEDYLEREDKRLKQRSRLLNETTVKPGPAVQFRSPIFTQHSLSKIVQKLGFGHFRSRPWFRDKFKTRLLRAEDDLERSLKTLENEIDLLDKKKGNYKRQQFHARLLSGAISAAKAAKVGTKAAHDANYEALEHFKKALEIEPDDLEALSYRGHQFVRLDRTQDAITDFQQVRELAGKQASAHGPDTSEYQALKRSEALASKYIAEIFESSGNANIGALGHLGRALREMPTLFEQERAELFELKGRICERLYRTNGTQHQLRDAQSSYNQADELYSRGKTPTAQAGKDRVSKALQELRTLKQDNNLATEDLPS